MKLFQTKEKVIGDSGIEEKNHIANLLVVLFCGISVVILVFLGIMTFLSIY